MRYFLYTLFFCLLCSSAVYAEDSTRIVGRGTPDDPYQVGKADHKVVIDGQFIEGEWEDALLFDLKYEYNPGENVTPPVKTEFFISYDQKNLYLAFRCYDPNPQEIRARLRDRDQVWADDNVSVTLDTFNDQRRAYNFGVNPFGVQADAINDEAAGDYDDQWNAIWDSAGQITDFGWQVEMAIPFSQLRIQDVEGTQVWGIDAKREYPRTVEHQIGLVPRQRGNNSYLSQIRKIEGFEGLTHGENLQIVPTITAGRIEERSDFPDGDLEEIDSISDAGVTARWGVTNNINISGTVNPDFSQVEADGVQLDINRRFTLYFSETRPFFLEGKNYFETREMNLLHTRNIVDPDYAFKVTGKEGPHTFGIFTARDKYTSIIIPGSEGSEAESFDFASDTTVARYQYDFGSNSNVGSMVTHRSGNGYSNTVFNLDTSVRFSESLHLVATAAHSNNTYNQQIAEMFALDKTDINGSAVAVELDYSQRSYSLETSYRQYDDSFRADLGFITKVDYRRWGANGEYRWYGDGTGLFTQIRIRGDYSQTELLDGQLLTRQFYANARYSGPMQSSVAVTAGSRKNSYEGVFYDQNFYQFRINGRPTGATYLNVWVNLSDEIDYTHNRAGDELGYGLYAEVNVGDHLEVGASTSVNNLDVEQGQLFNTFVQEANVSYQFSRRARLRTILQYAQIKRDLSLYEDTEDLNSEDRDVFMQVLFSYKINPQTVFYAGYDDSFVAENEIEMIRFRRGMFFKLGYAWLQ